MIEIDTIYNEDCLEGMHRIPDGSVDLIVCDPPYVIGNQGGGFWSKNPEASHYNARGTRKGMEKLGDIKDGFDTAILDEMCRVMKRVNIYVWCSQKQIRSDSCLREQIPERYGIHSVLPREGCADRGTLRH